MTLYNRYKQALRNKRKPCAFIDMDALDENITQIDLLANGKKIRIASKSIRSVAILKYILKKSQACKGIMCFTGEEAIYLHEQGLDDLLIAYPIWDEQILEQIGLQTQAGASIIVMVDSIEHINHLAKIATKINGCFSICIDMDMSTSFPMLHFGVYRSPVRTIEEVENLTTHIAKQTNITLQALMGYEAQIAGVTDANPYTKMKNNVIRMLKKHSIKQVAAKRQEMVAFLQKKFPTISIVNGGGTGSLHTTSTEQCVSEVTVGSGFFASHLFDKYRDFSFQPAAIYAIEITRLPNENMYTCYGGGYVASGTVSKDKLPEVYLPKGAKLTTNEGVGEVQTPVLYNGTEELTYGDPIFLRHSKAGELCERFNVLHLIKGEDIVETVTTYRGDGKCFL